jgi:hypothetical protein
VLAYKCVYPVCLHNTVCRTLVERLVGARLVYREPSMSRLVSFEYLNRQLVWQELSEFLLFLLPLINVTKASSELFVHTCWRGCVRTVGVLVQMLGRLLVDCPVLTSGVAGSTAFVAGHCLHA